jgi:chromosome segregation ATPase
VLLAMASASSAQTTSKSRVRAVKGPTVSAREVQQLRDALASQQQQMEQQRQEMEQLTSQLHQLLNSTQQTSTSAQKMESTAEQAQTSAAQAQQSATEAQPLADQASVNASDAKTQLSLVSAKTQDEDKKLSAGLGVQNKEYGADFKARQKTRTMSSSDTLGCARNKMQISHRLGKAISALRATCCSIVFTRCGRLRTNTLGSFTYWRGRVLNSNLENNANNAALTQKTITTAGQQEPWLNRFQFDLIDSF